MQVYPWSKNRNWIRRQGFTNFEVWDIHLAREKFFSEVSRLLNVNIQAKHIMWTYRRHIQNRNLKIFRETLDFGCNCMCLTRLSISSIELLAYLWSNITMAHSCKDRHAISEFKSNSKYFKYLECNELTSTTSHSSEFFAFLFISRSAWGTLFLWTSFSHCNKILIQSLRHHSTLIRL